MIYMPPKKQKRPALVEALLNLRRKLNHMADHFEWNSEMLDRVADMQATLLEAFRGARQLMQKPKK